MPLLKFLWRILNRTWKIFAAVHFEHCITLEIWSTCLSNKEVKEFVRQVVKRIKHEFTNAEILLVMRRHDIESRTHILLHFDGYEVLLSPNIDPQRLKNICMELELNSENKRVADIDVYSKREKISRKTAAILTQ